MKFRTNFIPYLFLFILAVSCTSQNEEPLTIALSKDNKNCHTWIASADSTAEVIELYTSSINEALTRLESCDALIITGGNDVYPGRYGKEADTIRCGRFDLRRDTLEIALIHKAIELGMPLLGICRGEQITNVALGGSLIIDIPTDVDTIVNHRLRQGYHEVTIESGTLMAQTTNVTNGNVTSAHHQAIDQLAEPLKISARSSLDGVVEAVEWKEPEGKSFLMAIQWHPERDMSGDPLSWNILNLLLQEAHDYQKIKPELELLNN